LRRAGEPVETDRTVVSETGNPIHCVVCRDLDEGVPVSQDLKEPDL
jgi:hypothetical protein